MNSRSGLIDLEVTILVDREKAWKVECKETGLRAWVPKEAAEIEDGVLTLPEDMAIEKGLL